MRCLPQNKAQRRYLNRFLPTMVIYVVAIYTAAWAFRHHHPTGVEAYLLALLPAIPIVGAIVVVGLYLIEEPDEFERTVLIQSMLWGIGGTLAITTVWGFLELFLSVQHLQPWLDFPIFWFLVGIATPVIRLRYK